MPEPAVAIAIVSWNNRALLERALRSAEAEFTAGNAEVWVVDNASEDGSAEMVRERFPWVSLIESSQNLGYGAAVGLVADRTSSEWIAAANDDAELTPGGLERLLGTGAELPAAGAIAPRLVLPDGSTQHSVHSFPSLMLGLVFNSGLYRLSGRLSERLCITGYWDPERRREVPWALAAWLLVRRRAWEQVGGFDESQWMYTEDLDLAWRLRGAGWKVVFEPGATVLHQDQAASTKAFGDQTLARHTEASYAWLARRRGTRFARIYALQNVAGAAIRLAAYTVLAGLRPARYGPARRRYRMWLGLHGAALRRVG